MQNEKEGTKTTRNGKKPAKELNTRKKELRERVLRLGVERLMYTEPKIYENRLNKKLPKPIKVTCTIGSSNLDFLALVIRIDKDDNEYVYRNIIHLMSGYQKLEDTIAEIIELYNKERHSRTPYLEIPGTHTWSCLGCESYRREDNVCFKDCQGVGNHPDFPCVLHEIRSDIINPKGG